ncbi:hypothetical protein KDD30_17285 (plasmid) [Photobacterium sp. GJ3]|uniref:hypothetical protein n=1 Tax=Photobacterium sp. GJ3 TaxID=2829502 RepID=UPI001B8AF634|nr:hypothetical protein [Photobacterium sp. GJ3]QUJ69922.1 hypothetical protein KDD30_17285 [Photobacterium sp. GJ3]
MSHQRSCWKSAAALLVFFGLSGCGGGSEASDKNQLQERDSAAQENDSGSESAFPSTGDGTGPVPVENSVSDNTIEVDGQVYTDLASAEAAILAGSQVVIGNGVYSRGLKIQPDNVTVIGSGETHFKGAQLMGKATFIVNGHGVRIENIECSQVSVPDQNGACVRQQGRDLVLSQVYFHDSEQGVLSASGTGSLTIEHSVFERLGKAGRAHAVYSNNDSLTIRYSRFYSSKDQGHEIKSRAKYTLIEYSEIASLSGDDSRLVDAPNGGELVIRDSVLEQGPNSANRQLIGFGLEAAYDATQSNRVTLSNNVIILDRPAGSQLLALPAAGGFELSVSQNEIVGSAPVDKADYVSENTFYDTRAAYGLSEFPALPETGF